MVSNVHSNTLVKPNRITNRIYGYVSDCGNKSRNGISKHSLTMWHQLNFTKLLRRRIKGVLRNTMENNNYKIQSDTMGLSSIYEGLINVKKKRLLS